MNIKKLFFAGGKCLTLDMFPGRADELAREFSSGEIPVIDFILFCDGHLVLPSIYKKLKSHKLLGTFPSEFAAHLEDIYSRNQQRNYDIIQQAKEISLTLKQEGIIPVYLKGAAHLLDGLYSDPGERLMGDIDFLVTKNNYLTTARLLIDKGYKPPPRFYGDVSLLKHYPRLFRKDVPADLEIHQVPVNLKYAKQFNSDMVFRQKKIITKNANCYVPCDEHKMVHNFIHSQLSNSGYRFKHTSLRDLYDLYLLSKRVKPQKVLPLIEERNKAGGYFLLADNVLGLQQKLYSTRHRKAYLHYKISNLALQYPRIFNMYKRFIKLSELILKRYLGRIIKAVYQKSSRRFIARRLKDPQWYRLHIAGLKKYLKN